MMIGGDDAAVKHIDPILRALAPGVGAITRTHRPKSKGEWQAEMGYVHCGPAGSGHFVKMVHNGIEYGMMQAYAEGFDILKQRASEDLPEGLRFGLNLSDISEVWRRGSVISSWLLDLIAIALAEDQSLSKYSGRVADSGEGRWTIDAAIEESRSGRRARGRLVRSLPQPGRGKLRRPTAFRHALWLRRPCRDAAIGLRPGSGIHLSPPRRGII
jgi:6-phosphogluconate dehydrogenase